MLTHNALHLNKMYIYIVVMYTQTEEDIALDEISWRYVCIFPLVINLHMFYPDMSCNFYIANI